MDRKIAATFSRHEHGAEGPRPPAPDKQYYSESMAEPVSSVSSTREDSSRVDDAEEKESQRSPGVSSHGTCSEEGSRPMTTTPPLPLVTGGGRPALVSESHENKSSSSRSATFSSSRSSPSPGADVVALSGQDGTPFFFEVVRAIGRGAFGDVLEVVPIASCFKDGGFSKDIAPNGIPNNHDYVAPASSQRGHLDNTSAHPHQRMLVPYIPNPGNGNPKTGSENAGEGFALKKVLVMSDYQFHAVLEEVRLLRSLVGHPNIVQLLAAEVASTPERSGGADESRRNASSPRAGNYIGASKHAYLLLELAACDFRMHMEHVGDYMPLTEVADCWSQAARAVQGVHACGIVHFDIKPENFLCFFRPGSRADTPKSDNLILKLADFGVSAKMQTDDTHISKAAPVGTIKYMAPETICQVGFLDIVRVICLCDNDIVVALWNHVGYSSMRCSYFLYVLLVSQRKICTHRTSSIILPCLIFLGRFSPSSGPEAPFCRRRVVAGHHSVRADIPRYALGCSAATGWIPEDHVRDRVQAIVRDTVPRYLRRTILVSEREESFGEDVLRTRVL